MLIAFRPTRAQRRAADAVARVLLFLAAAAMAAVGASLLLALMAGEAAATEVVPMKPKEAQTGALLLKTAAGETLAVPLVATDADIRVSGMVARARVRQVFRNPSDDWHEGIYVFPLPENAAVDRLRIRVGERVIEGQIRERQAAKAAYEQARASGQRAALLEQERPNMFTSSVANVGPREEITVELEYQQTLRYDAGRYSLRFPTVVGPRYIPGSPVAAATPTGWAPPTDQVPDAPRVTPPVLRPAEGARPANPVSIRVVLDAGVPLATVASAYHAVDVREIDAGRREVVLKDTTYATRDFELGWSVAPDRTPKLALFTEQRDGRNFALLMLMPPTAATPAARLPREVVFVIDTSGSMHGTSIAQAKEALEMAVRRLAPADRFNVIEFNSYAQPLFADARPATAENRERAVRWVRDLRAQGGTEMAAALTLALHGRESADRVRQVVFLTDGAVGNEEALFKLIADRIGDSRLFTVGIGSAPNSHFMTKAAQTGRGTFTYIGKVEEVKERMSELFAKLESPVLKNVRVEWPGGEAVETWPKRVPDLYLGEPIVVTAALDRTDGELVVSGVLGDSPWRMHLPMSRASEGEGMGVLWAREKVAALMDSLREGASEAEVRNHVIELATTHRLVTRYTSFVAIEQQRVRPADAALKQAAIPTNLPEGWSYEAVFGELPQGATDAWFNLLSGVLLLAMAATALTARRRIRV
jgi:Ca-activated chloride channel family protein